MPVVGVGVFLRNMERGRGGGALPLTPPRNLRSSQDKDGITFTWDAPISFGQHGPAGNRYGYQFRFNTAGRADARPWPGEARQPENTETFAWSTPADSDESVQFRVRAWDADGNASAWVTSPVIAEQQTAPQRNGGPFSREFGREFEGGA